MSARPWTPEEDARLLSMRAGGEVYAQIAAALDRPLSSVASRLIVIKEALKAGSKTIGRPAARTVGQHAHIKDGGAGERKPRRCLCCGKTFASAHAGNRMCNTCRLKPVSPFDPA